MSFERRSYGEDIHITEKDNPVEKKLAYTTEAKDFIKSHPGIIRAILNGIGTEEMNYFRGGYELVEPGLKKEINGVLIETFDTERNNWVYKITVDEKSFFLKLSEDFDISDGYAPTYDGGAAEVLSSAKAEEIFSGEDDVKVIKAHFGFSKGPKNNQIKYYASDWNESALINAQQYRALLIKDLEQGKISQEVLENFEKRSSAILEKLDSHGFHDTGLFNMAYDPEQQQFILFDLALQNETN